MACSRRASANRSEEHTSELQSLRHLVCRLLLEKKKKKKYSTDQETRTGWYAPRHLDVRGSVPSASPCSSRCGRVPLTLCLFCFFFFFLMKRPPPSSPLFPYPPLFR